MWKKRVGSVCYIVKKWYFCTPIIIKQGKLCESMSRQIVSLAGTTSHLKACR